MICRFFDIYFSKQLCNKFYYKYNKIIVSLLQIKYNVK